MNTVRNQSTYSNDIESQIDSIKNEEVRENVQRISSILQNSESRSSVNDDLFGFYMKLFMLFIILVCLIPFVVCNLYYAYSDKSCVHEKAGKLDVNLFNYLVVDGIFGAVVAIVWFLQICSFNFTEDSEITFGRWLIVVLITGIGSVFGLAWTITGAIIFWSLIDNNLCDNGIYNYVFAQLIIKLIGYGIGILKNKSEKK
jgi:hypothetical protein